MSRRAAIAVAVAVAGSIAVSAVLLAASGGAPRATVEPLRIASGNGIATGFAVGERRVVTVAHVLEGRVTVAGARARVLRVDRRDDLALLSVPGISAPRRSPASGTESAAVRVLRIRDGRASPLRARVRRAIVAHVRAPGAERAYRRPALELGARVSAGDSGAPVLTAAGRVAGVVFAASRSRPDTAYAVDGSALRSLLRR